LTMDDRRWMLDGPWSVVRGRFINIDTFKGEKKSVNQNQPQIKRGGGLSYFLYDLHHWLV